MKSSKLPGMLSVKSKKGLDYMDMILKTTDLCKNFKGQMAVNNVSLNIRRNSVYGLLGPNGAGKSTILKMLTGILRPTSGSIEFDGHPWKRNDLEHIGALIEMPPLYEKSDCIRKSQKSELHCSAWTMHELTRYCKLSSSRIPARNGPGSFLLV